MALTVEFIKSIIDDGIFFSSDRQTIEYLLEKDLDPLGEYALLVSDTCTKLIQLASLLEEKIEYKNVYVDEKVEPVLGIKFFEDNHNTVNYIGKRLHEESLIKDERQISNIEDTLALNKAAYNAIAKRMKPGISEMDLFCIIKQTYNEKTSENIEFISDVVAGKRTSQVSGAPTGYQLSGGDAVILDLLPKYKGIYCDTTRTIFLDQPSPKKQEIYKILIEAMEIGRERLKPGVCAEDVYYLIYNHLKKYGYENNFPHHAGHGFGRTIYEMPYFLPQCKMELKENMVVTLEPGIYLPDEFGIRVENNYQITKNGARLLGNIPLEIEANIA